MVAEFPSFEILFQENSLLWNYMSRNFSDKLMLSWQVVLKTWPITICSYVGAEFDSRYNLVYTVLGLWSFRPICKSWVYYMSGKLTMPPLSWRDSRLIKICRLCKISKFRKTSCFFRYAKRKTKICVIALSSTHSNRIQASHFLSDIWTAVTFLARTANSCMNYPTDLFTISIPLCQSINVVKFDDRRILRLLDCGKVGRDLFFFEGIA